MASESAAGWVIPINGSTEIFIQATCSVSNGHLSGVIDFGNLTCGDPATDVSVLDAAAIDSIEVRGMGGRRP